MLDLSTRIPMAAAGLGEIMAEAGQAGTAREELLRFTEDAANMGVAFELTGRQAGKAMAGLRTIFRLGQDDVVALRQQPAGPPPVCPPAAAVRPELARVAVPVPTLSSYDALVKGSCCLLFGFISQRYERRSLVVTTNLPFARWSEVFLDPTAAAAVIDRIVHHAAVLQTTGDSYRLAAAKRNRGPSSGRKGAR